GAAVGKAADEHVGPVAVRAGRVVFDEDVVPDQGAAGLRRDARRVGARLLVFDLHAVADGVLDEVVLDDAPDEGGGTVRVAEVEAGAAVLDEVAPDGPVP